MTVLGELEATGEKFSIDTSVFNAGADRVAPSARVTPALTARALRPKVRNRRRSSAGCFIVIAGPQPNVKEYA